MSSWVIRATSEDRDRGRSLLLDNLRAGLITHAEYLSRLAVIDKAKYTGEVYDQVFSSSSALRRRGFWRFFSLRKLNAACILLSLAVFLGVGGDSTIRWVIVGTAVLITMAANVYRMIRMRRIARKTVHKPVDL